ncbi:DUF2972 domain-containing protein [Campylobacter jejuni]|nr:DUF2972 domain-containing protein [Campylobacter jejuni]MBM0669907.1 DUF2972 domain-containing protein [Campylobacter jejuni]MBM0692912.1 DUF2972 domain-containing protein [Campylobacter jejuni]MCG0003847.1 DUF2972 domain-containing protein [Campylobacter jejuni]HEC1121098.1 DUF2972 domain-containing protein [Campylobacter jejuni]
MQTMGGGYIALFKKLYKIKKQHKKEQKIYKQTIQVFPQLKYPSLETCPDYSESLRYKFHLSYMLGEVLIKADMNKFKDGYFFLFKNIEQTKKDYKIIKEILDLSKKFEENIYAILAENKNLFMCNLGNLKIILDLHKNYIPALKVIFQNFNYTLNHLEMIKKWFLSNKFNKRYKKNQHPFPPLLDYNNVQSQKLSSDLFWSLNIPLNEYRFLFLANSGSGTMAMLLFFQLSCFKTYTTFWEDYRNIFFHHCELQKNKKTDTNHLLITASTHINQFCEKFYALLPNIKIIFFVVRDPISVIKHMINHISDKTIENVNDGIKILSLKTPFCNLFPNIDYYYSDLEKHIPEISSIERVILDAENGLFFTTQRRLNIIKKFNHINKIECINFLDIDKKTAFDSFVKLANKYDFIPPSDLIPFSGRVNRNQGDLIYLPVILRLHPSDLISIDQDDSISSLENEIDIIITTHQIHSNKDGFSDITSKIFDDKKLMFDNIILLILNEKYDILINNQELFLASKKYLNNYINALEKHEKKIRDHLITEDKILNYLKNKKDLRHRLKKILDQDLIYVNENYPEYLKQWKYYQKFEQMCNET